MYSYTFKNNLKVLVTWISASCKSVSRSSIRFFLTGGYRPAATCVHVFSDRRQLRTKRPCRLKFEGRTWCFNCNLTGINCQNNYCIYFVVRRTHVHLINIFSSDMDNRNILVYSRPDGKGRVMFRFHADMKWKCEIVAKILTFVFVLEYKTKCHLKGKWLPPSGQFFEIFWEVIGNFN